MLKNYYVRHTDTSLYNKHISHIIKYLFTLDISVKLFFLFVVSCYKVIFLVHTGILISGNHEDGLPIHVFHIEY